MTEEQNLPEAEEQEQIVVITDEEGKETYFLEEMVVPVEGKSFAILVEIKGELEEEEADEEDDEDENVIVARIDFDDQGEPLYVDPTEEEFKAFQVAYEALMAEEE